MLTTTLPEQRFFIYWKKIIKAFSFQPGKVQWFSQHSSALLNRRTFLQMRSARGQRQRISDTGRRVGSRTKGISPGGRKTSLTRKPCLHGVAFQFFFVFKRKCKLKCLKNQESRECTCNQEKILRSKNQCEKINNISKPDNPFCDIVEKFAKLQTAHTYHQPFLLFLTIHCI